MKCNIFVDSGAHSFYMKAQLKGESLNDEEFDQYFEDYMAFLKKYESYIDVCVNLDVINDPEKSYENYLKMCDRGFKPIAVVHPGEDPSWVKKYLDLGCEYIGLGGLGQFYTKSKYILWADDVWQNYLTDTSGMPIVKVHGFAMTSLNLLYRYPWYSVDSTSWVLTSRFGSVYVPRKKQGEYIYDENSWKVTVSNRSPFIKEEGEHITTFTEMERNHILEYFEEKGYKLGKSEIRSVDSKTYKLKEGERWFAKEEADSQRNVHGEEARDGYVKEGWTKERKVEIVVESGLCNDYRQRDELNIIYFLDLEKNMPKWPQPFKLKGIQGFGLK